MMKTKTTGRVHDKNVESIKNENFVRISQVPEREQLVALDFVMRCSSTGILNEYKEWKKAKENDNEFPIILNDLDVNQPGYVAEVWEDQRGNRYNGSPEPVEIEFDTERNRDLVSNKEDIPRAQGNLPFVIQHQHQVPFLESLAQKLSANTLNSPDEKKSDSWLPNLNTGFKMLFSTHTIHVLLPVTILIFLARRDLGSRRLVFAILTFSVAYMLTNSVAMKGIETFYNAWNNLSDSISKEEEKLDVDENNEEIMMEPIQAQSFLDSETFLTPLLLTVLGTGIGFRPRDKLLSTLNTLLKFNDVQKSNMTAVILFASTRLSEFFTTVIKNDTLSDYFHVDVVKDDDVKDFRDEVQLFISECYAGKRLNSEHNEIVYNTFRENSIKIYKTLDRKSYEFSTVQQSLRDLEKCRNAMLAQFSSLSGDRVEPVGVFITGVPGCMKSVLMRRLGVLIAHQTIPSDWRDEFKEKPDNFMYVVPTDKFYDKYNYKSWITYFDDIFQKRDGISDTESEALKIKSMINSAPYCLPLAEVNSKNSKYFRSPFVLMTSNISKPENIASVNDPKAIFRRFNIEIKTLINRKYCNDDGTLNEASLPMYALDWQEGVVDTNANISAIPNDFWDLYVTLKRANKVVEMGKMSLKNVVKMIIVEHRQRIKHFYVNRSTTASFIDELSREIAEDPVRDIYSHLFRDSFEVPGSVNIMTAQSSIDSGVSRDDFSDESDSDTDETIRPSSVSTKDVAWSRFVDFLFLNPQARFQHENEYWECLNLYGRAIFYDHDYENLKRHLFGINEESRNSIFLVQNDPVEFWRLVNLSFSTYIALGVDPITFDYLPILESSMFKRNFKTYFWKPFKRFLKYISDNKIFFIAMGIGVFVFLKYLTKAFSALVEPNAQSLDSRRVGIKVSKQTLRNVQKFKLSEKKVEPSFVSHGLNIKDIEMREIPKLISSDFINASRDSLADVKANIMNKSFFVAYIVWPKDDHDKYTRLGHAWNLKGNYFTAPFHFTYLMNEILEADETKKVYLMLVNPARKVYYKNFVCDILMKFNVTDESCDNDNMIFHMPSANPNAIGMYRFLVKEDDVKSMRNTGGFSSSLIGSSHLMDNSFIMRQAQFKAKFLSEPTFIYSTWDPIGMYALGSGFTYTASVSSGDCGSMLFIDSTKFSNRCVIGMHVAGTKTDGFSNILTQEYFDRMLEACKDKMEKLITFEDEEIPDTVEYFDEIVAQSGLFPVAKFSPGIAPNTVYASEIRRSKLYGKLPSPYDIVEDMPAKLRDFVDYQTGEKISPKKKALEAYSIDTIPLKQEHVESAAESYYDLIREHDTTPWASRRVIPMKQAMVSFGNVNGMAPSTSPGFPYNTRSVENLKKLYYQAKETGDPMLISKFEERIATVVQEHLDKYAKRVRPFFIYTDCLKDETRSKVKVLMGKTRMFSGAPWILQILMRMYFGAFIDMYFGLNTKIGSALGANPYSSDWDALARYLQKHNDGEPSVGAGDYTHYDGHQKVSMHMAVLWIILQWYGPEEEEDNQIRVMLFAEIVNSRHVFDEEIFEWFNSLPSGCSLTALINTIYNNLQIRVCWQECGYPVSQFNNNVYFVGLGDDHLYNVSKDYRELFNELTMPSLMKNCGMTYTNEMKEKATVSFRKLTEVEFLKRRFKYCKISCRWTAPLREESMMGMLNWTKKGLQGDTITLDNITNALREFALHGEDKYNFWYKALDNLRLSHFEGMTPSKWPSSDYRRALKDTLNIDYNY